MKRRKLNFIKVKMHGNPNEIDIVHPIDKETGEEIDDVMACSIESGMDRITEMTIKIRLVPDIKSKEKIEWPENEKRLEQSLV